MADALEKARYFVLGCSDLIVALDYKPLLKILRDRALEDISNTRLRNLKEKTLRYRFRIVHKCIRKGHASLNGQGELLLKSSCGHLEFFDRGHSKYTLPKRVQKPAEPVLARTPVQVIMKTSPCNVYPLTPHFYIVKLGFTGVYIIFLFLL